MYETYQCTKDFSQLIKRVGIPMQKNVLTFYKKNNRYPNLKETTELMNNAGCKNNRQIEQRERKDDRGEIFENWASYDCDSGSLTLSYGVTVGDLRVQYNAVPYSFGLSKRNSHCSVNFTKDGDSRNFVCSQDSCFIKHWGH